MTALWAGFVFLPFAVCQPTPTVVPKDEVLYVRPNEPANLLCVSSLPLESCRFDVPSGRILNPKPGAPPVGGLAYYGDGFEKGHCGLHIQSTTDEWEGNYVCTVFPKDSWDSYKALTAITIAIAPQKPVLSVGDKYFNEGDRVIAKCKISKGRPAAKISWYLGGEKFTDGLEPPKTYNEDNITTTTEQIFSRPAKYTDHGKDLKCVGEHILLNSSNNNAFKKMFVFFAPKPEPVFEHRGLPEGDDARVSVVVQGNPPPTFTWSVNNKPFKEGDVDPTGKYRVLAPVQVKDKGPAFWQSTLVIKAITKEDAAKKYTVDAENNQGKQQYSVNISTVPKKPSDIKLSWLKLFMIVFSILFTLIVPPLLIFWLVKRWCGSDRSESIGPCSCEL
ncbi:hypothetical protein GE061_010706 [Apolygus lucorum]|uniref:Ig-like domain-containing protein n=1 Tax=Apolygus lucorum TaxID=248454 RepID=A0A6A4KAM6_APOLU|nr:hypothetical protein GE061_010706 [Apolygus lucorum]